ncbi:MAG: heme lyase NrfEFG subunit NrfE, partial [Pseudomonadales bacterium]
LNPLLQDFGLIVHPPMLYMGYVGMAVPFAFCISALWTGQLDRRWTRWARPWALLAWGFLSLGIALGSWWAYYELGWGGWWFWDPVENASLLPWLACTALLHSLAVSEKRGVFKAWTIMLAIFAFALSLLGTFLVRSGVITSVHSFASDPTRGMMILLILAIVIGSGLLLFAFRGWRLTVESQFQLKSRETLLVINNIIILVATLVVLLGTLYPIIADAVGWGQVSVGSPYFNALFVPLTWLLLLTMGVGSAIRWQADKRSLLRVGLVIGLMIVASSVVLAGVVAFFLQANDWLINGWLINDWLNLALTLALSAWVLAWQLYDIKDKTKNANHSGKQLLTRQLLIKLKKLPLSYWGMQTAHIGVLIIAIGVAVTTSQSIEKDVALGVGDKVRVQGYDFAMTDMYQISAQNYDATVAEIIVSKNGNYISSLRPEKRTYVVSMMPMTESAIDASLWRDVYVALGEPIVLNKQTVNENQAQNQLTQLQPQQSEKWAVRIYVKPFVRWLWLGALVMVLGALLSLLDRRYWLKPSP